MIHNWIPKEFLKKIGNIFNHHEKEPNFEEQFYILKHTGLFDDEYYLIENSDVKNSEIDPLLHYLQRGWKEQRNPNLWFDAKLYLLENPESKVFSNPFFHYLFKGFIEGRRPNRYVPKDNHRLIVSLTLGESAFFKLNQSLKTMLEQTIKPDKIIINLNRDKDYKNGICYNCLDLIDNGIDVKWVSGLYKYEAFLSTIKEYPNDYIVYASCEYMYDVNFISNLWKHYYDNPTKLICYAKIPNRFIFEHNNNIYELTNDERGNCVIPASQFGILVPPGLWSERIFDAETYSRIAPLYPDLWYWIHTVCDNKQVEMINDDIKPIQNMRYRYDEFCSQLLSQQDSMYNSVIGLIYQYKDILSKECGIGTYNHIINNYVSGLYTRYTGKKIKLKQCKTFNEKIQYLKIYDDKPIKSIITDKYNARKYIKSLIGDKYLVKLIGVWNDAHEIDFSKLPKQLVLKVNHCSGKNMIISDITRLDREKAICKLNEWLKINYAYSGAEFNYFHIHPLIIAEEFLGADITDYRFVCAFGKIKFIYTDVGKYSDYRRNIYDEDWNLLPWEWAHPNTPHSIAKPKMFSKMKELAGILSKDFPFVRVDFFISGDTLKVGELTFYPAAGYTNFSPSDAEFIAGNAIDLRTINVSAGKTCVR